MRWPATFHSVHVAHYAALIQAKSTTNCDAYLAESIFKHVIEKCSCQRKRNSDDCTFAFVILNG